MALARTALMSLAMSAFEIVTNDSDKSISKDGGDLVWQ